MLKYVLVLVLNTSVAAVPGYDDFTLCAAAGEQYIAHMTAAFEGTPVHVAAFCIPGPQAGGTAGPQGGADSPELSPTCDSYRCTFTLPAPAIPELLALCQRGNLIGPC